MAAVCTATPFAGLQTGSPMHTLSIVLAAWFPVFVAISVGTFWYYSNSSVFLRKRSIGLLLWSCSGAMFVWAVTVLYDSLGSGYYPCALFGFLHYIAIPCNAIPLLFKLSKYSVEVSILKLSKEIRIQRQEERQQQQQLFTSGRASSPTGSNGGMETIPIGQEDVGLDGKISLTTLSAHLRVISRLSRSRKDRILNAKFCRSPGFPIFWFVLCALPYLLVYFIRLVTDPRWSSGCSGCDLSMIDAAVIMCLIAFTTSCGVLSNSFKVSKRDALRVVRECVVTWSLSGVLGVVGLALYLADPGELYKQGIVNWRILVFAGSVVVVYVQTIHQVLIARRLKHQIIVSNDFNRADKFVDVMNDRALKEQLRQHLNRELSSEIMMFLEAVDQFKSIGSNPSLSQHTAAEQFKRQSKLIYDAFIRKSAPNEINISSEQREAVLVRMVQLNQLGAIDFTVFDNAYEEVKGNLLRDGFGRFLARLRSVSEQNKSLGERARYLSMASSSSNSSWLSPGSPTTKTTKTHNHSTPGDTIARSDGAGAM